MNLILYQGNNYYNRKVVYAESDQEYIDTHGFVGIANVPGSSFIVNNNINTTQIVNYDHDANGFGDYLIAYYSDGSIHSRWWVLESAVLRRGQVRLSLLRDVLADWYTDVIKAPAYIKKGYPQSINDPAIFNNENMNFNQIKQRETFIKDKSKAGWYVGYLTKKELTEEQRTIYIPGRNVEVTDIYTDISQYAYSAYTAANPYMGELGALCCNFFCYVPNGVLYCAGFDGAGNPFTPSISGYSSQDWTPNGVVMRNDANNPRGFRYTGDALYDGSLWRNASGKAWREAASAEVGAHSQSQVDSFFNGQNGRYIQVGGVTKKVVIKEVYIHKTVDANNSQTFGQLMYHLASLCGMSTSSGVQGIVSSITFTATGYYVDYETVPSTETGPTYVIPANKTTTENAPYDIFAIPATPIGMINNPYGSDPGFSQRVLASFISQLDTSILYDVQYVPYCPLSDEYLYDSVIDTQALSAGSTTNFSYIKIGTGMGDDLAWTCVIYASTDTFSKKISSSKIQVPDDVEEYKVANECDMYRLCSPNYNGQFEFSAAKNGGVTGWNISFTYKPYNPYIKVSPIFGRLYGQDFGDARGLICGGDFSVAQIDDEWKRYELNNKNYQVMFDRQIQNMEVNNSVQRELEKWNRGTGIAQGTATGVMGGAMSGGGVVGAVVGGAVGGTVSAYGGMVDRRLNETLRGEALSYAQDQYGYNLQNIKALPYSLTKVGAQNADYKTWPFVEKYTCTDIEKTALKSKLQWNGYAIERIGTISNFLKQEGETYIQGTVIRLDSIGADSHIADTINAELQTGVYYV